MTTDIRLALSHMLVGASTVWCVVNTYKGGDVQWEWMYGAYAPLCVYSLSGMGVYGAGVENEEALDVYKYSVDFSTIIPVSFYTTALAIHQGIEEQFAAVAAALPVIPAGMLAANKEWNEDVVDGIVLASAALGATLAAMKENYLGLVASVTALFNHFVGKNVAIAEIPTRIVYNAGLCFFLFCAVDSLKCHHHYFVPN